jgi:hypothetical protein
MRQGGERRERLASATAIRGRGKTTPAGKATKVVEASPCADCYGASEARYQMKMTGRTRGVGRGVGYGTGLAGLLVQRLGHGHGEGNTHGLAAAGQGKPTRGAQTKEIAKELHWPISFNTVPAAPLGAGRTSLVEESAGQPLAVAANDQLVMQCRHPMLADVDVATRVNVHMPWLSSDRGPAGHVAPVGACIVMLRCGSVKHRT